MARERRYEDEGKFVTPEIYSCGSYKIILRMVDFAMLK